VPPVNGQYPTFVDNSFSLFGFGSPLGGYKGLGSVADVALRPEVLYLPPGTHTTNDIFSILFGSHDYPPAWYTQASLMQDPPVNGLGWSPLLNPLAAPGGGLYQQTWQQPIFSQQFNLSGPTTPPSYTPMFTPLQYARQYTVGNTTDDGSTISLSVDGSTPTSVLAMTFNPLAAQGQDGTGMDFKVQFSNVSPGANVQLVVWVRGLAGANEPLVGVNKGTFGYLSIPLFVMGAAEAGAAAQQATISLDGFLAKGRFWGRTAPRRCQSSASP
jgi:hypothetical protein